MTNAGLTLRRPPGGHQELGSFSPVAWGSRSSPLLGCAAGEVSHGQERAPEPDTANTSSHSSFLSRGYFGALAEQEELGHFNREKELLAAGAMLCTPGAGAHAPHPLSDPPRHMSLPLKSPPLVHTTASACRDPSGFPMRRGPFKQRKVYQELNPNQATSPSSPAELRERGEEPHTIIKLSSSLTKGEWPSA